MCLSSPDAPVVAQRQAARDPQSSQRTGNDQDRMRRRMAYAASIMTSPQGATGAPATTATMRSTTGA
jgi:hypothetical protein